MGGRNVCPALEDGNMMRLGPQQLRDASYIEKPNFYVMYFYRRIGFYVVIGKAAHSGVRKGK